jgi:hypothetical protein
MLSGGREYPLSPRPAELYPRPAGPGLREEPYEPRSSVRPDDVGPIDVRPPGPPGLADSEDERGGIGENFCQPPPLLLPRSRAAVEPLELIRASGRAGELFSRPVERDPATGFCPDCPKRRKPLFELVLPGRATSRPFPIDLPFDPAALVPRAEKKC